MTAKTRSIVSIVLKLLVFISTTVGIIGCVVGVDGFMGGNTLTLYFSNQSLTAIKSLTHHFFAYGDVIVRGRYVTDE